MKALIYDLELTDLELKINTYELKNHTRYFHPDCIERDWSMLGAGWMWLDEDEPTTVAVSHKDVFNDEKIVRQTHKVLSSADMLIGHNSDAFDYKKFNTRAVYHGLPPISPKLSVDTLKMARKYFKFTSNKLSYLAKFLGVTLKGDSPDWELIKAGDRAEIKKMREYNALDCITTKEVYLKLRSFHHTHPSMNNPAVRDIEGNTVKVCRQCLSPRLRNVKTRYTNAGIARRQYQCRECRTYTTMERIK